MKNKYISNFLPILLYIVFTACTESEGLYPKIESQCAASNGIPSLGKKNILVYNTFNQNLSDSAANIDHLILWTTDQTFKVDNNIMDISLFYEWINFDETDEMPLVKVILNDGRIFNIKREDIEGELKLLETFSGSFLYELDFNFESSSIKVSDMGDKYDLKCNDMVIVGG